LQIDQVEARDFPVRPADSGLWTGTTCLQDSKWNACVLLPALNRRKLGNLIYRYNFPSHLFAKIPRRAIYVTSYEKPHFGESPTN